MDQSALSRGVGGLRECTDGSGSRGSAVLKRKTVGNDPGPSVPVTLCVILVLHGPEVALCAGSPVLLCGHTHVIQLPWEWISDSGAGLH